MGKDVEHFIDWVKTGEILENTNKLIKTCTHFRLFRTRF